MIVNVFNIVYFINNLDLGLNFLFIYFWLGRGGLYWKFLLSKWYKKIIKQLIGGNEIKIDIKIRIYR